MFQLLKALFYILIIGGIAGAVWFLPKYSYVQENPGFCVNLTTHLYYCGKDGEMPKPSQK